MTLLGLIATCVPCLAAPTCADIPELEVGVNICEANLQFYQDRYELAVHSAIQRSGNAPQIEEEDRRFQNALLGQCSNLQCIADSYSNQTMYLDNMEFLPVAAESMDGNQEAGTEEVQYPEEDFTAPYPADTNSNLSAAAPAPRTSPYEATSVELTAPEPPTTPPSDHEPAAQVVPEAAREDHPHGVGDQLQALGLWGALGGLVLLLLMAATNRIVVFYDYTDAWWSVAPLIFIILGLFVAGSLAPPGSDELAATFLEKVILTVAILLALLAILISYRNAIHYNRSVALGLLVGTCKLLIAIPMAITFFGSLRKVFDPKLGRQQNLAALFMVFILGALWAVLVNGKRVHQRKGWLQDHASGGHESGARPSPPTKSPTVVRRIA